MHGRMKRGWHNRRPLFGFDGGQLDRSDEDGGAGCSGVLRRLAVIRNEPTPQTVRNDDLKKPRSGGARFPFGF